MRIIEVTLSTTHIDQQEYLFGKTLGFKCKRTKSELLVDAGQTTLRFVNAEKQYYYHYCFLVPTVRMQSVCEFLHKRHIEPLLYHGKRIVPFGETGEAVYFHDADGNIAEFIHRPSLKLTSKTKFLIGDVVCLNEIGIPVEQPRQQCQIFIERFGIELAEGVMIRDDFAWCGDYEGVLLLPKSGRHWMPCAKPCERNKVHVKFETGRGRFELIVDPAHEIP